MESVQVDYDPSRISYQDLVDIFWEGAPTYESPSRQYTAAIYYNNEEQKQIALNSVELQEKKLGRKTYIEVLPFSAFYLAEGYHQKYYLSNSVDFYREFRVIYPDETDFINSTAAARVNGYLVGVGNPEVFNNELDSYGLSPEGKKRLLEIGSRLFPPGSIKTCSVRQQG